MDAVAFALESIFLWPGPLLLLVGVTVGMVVAILPGLGGATAMAIIIPITYTMSPEHALLFLAAIMGAGGFAGSLTAILLNAPGESVNAATTVDGYPLARQGQGGLAVAASAVASALGALLGLLLFIITIPLIRSIILSFGAPEYFAIAVAGLLLIGAVSGRSPVKGLLAGIVGMLLGFHGFNQVVGGARYTFGMTEMIDGISLIALLAGIFPLAEMIELLRERRAIAQKEVRLAKGEIRRGIGTTLRHWRLVVASSAIGWFVGLIPGVGGSVSNWAAYSAAYYTARDKSKFGQGDIRGVIAPEAANDAKDGGSLIPTLMLGIPGSVSTAIILSAFLIHGVTPGARLFNQDFHITWVIILGLVAANVATSTIGLTFARPLVGITALPSTVIAPIVMVFAIAGTYAHRRALFDLATLAVFGLIGFAMLRFGWSRAAVIIGFILAPIAERSFHQALQLGRGSYDIFLDRPITLGLLIGTTVVIALVLVSKTVLARKASAARVSIGAEDESDAPARQGRSAALAEGLFMLGMSAYVLVLFTETLGLGSRSRAFPMVILVPAMLLIPALLAILGRQLWRSRADAGPVPAAQEDATDEAKVYVVILWMAACFASILTLGFIVGGLVFLLGFGLFFAGLSLPKAAAVSLGVTLCQYLIFVELLGVRMYAGWLGLF